MKQIDFSFTETLKSALIPHISLEINFSGSATWVAEAETFAIDRVFWGNSEKHIFILTPQDFTAELTLELQQAEPGDFGRFLSKCRTEAHKAATEAGFFDAEPAEHRNDHNSGFVPNPNDRKYMNADY